MNRNLLWELYCMVIETWWKAEKLLNLTAVLDNFIWSCSQCKNTFWKMVRIVKHTRFHLHSIIWAWHKTKLSVNDGTQAASSIKL